MLDGQLADWLADVGGCVGERVRGRVRARLGGWVGSVEWMGGRMVGETVDG